MGYAQLLTLVTLLTLASQTARAALLLASPPPPRHHGRRWTVCVLPTSPSPAAAAPRHPGAMVTGMVAGRARLRDGAAVSYTHARTHTQTHTHTITSSVARNLWGIGLPLLLALGLTHRHESRGPTGRRGGHGGGQEGSSLERGWGGTPWERETTPHTGRDTDGRTAAGGRGERERERYQVVEAFELRAVTLHSPHGLHARAHTHTRAVTGVRVERRLIIDPDHGTVECRDRVFPLTRIQGRPCFVLAQRSS